MGNMYLRIELVHNALKHTKMFEVFVPSIFLTLCMSRSREGAGAGDSSSAGGGGSTGGSPSSSSKYQSYCKEKQLINTKCFNIKMLRDMIVLKEFLHENKFWFSPVFAKTCSFVQLMAYPRRSPTSGRLVCYG